MDVKGFEALAARLPELNSAGGRIKIAAYFLGVFALVTIYFILTDRIPTWTFDSQIVVMAIGFLIASRVITQRKIMLARYGVDAYRQAILRFAVPGIATLLAAVIHMAYMNGPRFSSSLLSIILTWLGWISIVMGATLWIRSAFAFGFDNLGLLYVYFPEKGWVVESEIYGALRHPVYAGIIRVGVGLACLNQSVFALTFALLLPLGFFGWVRLVEEKELLERLPEYAEYRKRIPAFFPYPNRIPAFFKFLLTGK